MVRAMPDLRHCNRIEYHLVKTDGEIELDNELTMLCPICGEPPESIGEHFTAQHAAIQRLCDTCERIHPPTDAGTFAMYFAPDKPNPICDYSHLIDKENLSTKGEYEDV